MISHVHTGTVEGMTGIPVTVEVDLANGLPGLTIVGLPDTAISEAKERIKAGIKNSGFEVPLKKVVFNLAPADIRKEGTGFDLPMTVGLLLSSGTLQATEDTDKTCFIGEVSLAGDLRRVHGVLSLAIMAKEQGFTRLVVPEDNRDEAALVEGIDVFGLKSLKDLPLFFLHPHSFLKPINRHAIMERLETEQTDTFVDMKDIKGQHTAKRALEISAAGGHNMLMIGPPGSGKSLLAKAFSGILPPLTFDEMLEVSQVYSVSGLLNQHKTLVAHRPFRSPHHSASIPGIIGGGSHPKPGEISLAHRGVLFLDEFVEFPRHVLEVLRQPLEDGNVSISRARHNVSFPAKSILLAAMNPCPCGFRGDASKQCTDTDHQIQRYVSKLSGPLLDRIDLHIEVPRLSDEELLNLSNRNFNPTKESENTNEKNRETSTAIRNRVIKARKLQTQRFSDQPITCNAEMPPHLIKTYCQLDEAGTNVMKHALQQLQLSARAYDRILRLSRTIADLANAEHIETNHLAEALQYRAMDRLYKLNQEQKHPQRSIA